MSIKKQWFIGIAGHRHLPSGRIPALTTKIQSFYQKEITRCGTDSISVLSSLAAGADTLCARLALDAGLRLIVPLPMNALEYRKDFSETAAAEFDCLLSLADQVFVASPEESLSKNPQRGFYYRQAGIYIVKSCDVLLVVWDGIEKDTPDGAGTWETVKLARNIGKKVHRVLV